MQSEPTSCHFRKKWYITLQDRVLLKINKGIEQAACIVIDNISNWSKGRVKTRFNSRNKGQQRKRFCRTRVLTKCTEKYRRNKTFYIQTNEVKTTSPREVCFDGTTAQAAIDNRCTASISNDTRDFIGKLTPITINLKSYKGEEQVEMMKGTLLWHWKDDEGKTHSFKSLIVTMIQRDQDS